MTRQHVSVPVEIDVSLNGSFEQVRQLMHGWEVKHCLNEGDFLSFEHISSYDYSALNVNLTRLENDREYETRRELEAKEAIAAAKRRVKTRESKLAQFEKLKKELGL
jgi:hypothetical protein